MEVVQTTLATLSFVTLNCDLLPLPSIVYTVSGKNGTTIFDCNFAKY